MGKGLPAITAAVGLLALTSGGVMKWSLSIVCSAALSLFASAQQRSTAAHATVPSQTVWIAPSPKEVVNTKSACLRLTMGQHSCSATAILSNGRETLVVSCNHCFAKQPFPGAPFPRGKYPQKCTLYSLDGKEKYDGTAIDGNPESDISLIVVEIKLSVCVIGTGKVVVGERCEHYGISSVHATGRITHYSTGEGQRGDTSQRSTSSSIPGDSGAGVFVNGKLAAVNWGYYVRSREQGGTAVVYVLRFAASSVRLSRDYPELWSSLPKAELLLPLPTPAPQPEIVTPPNCPGGVCPVPQQQPRFPIIRRIFGR